MMTLDGLETQSLPLSRVPSLRSGEAHVWMMRLENLPVMETRTPERRVDALRQRRMGQRFVLRLLLGAYLGVPGRDVALSRTDAGKPVLAPSHSDSELAFNLSHAGALLAVAVARGVAIGIDIESRDRHVRTAALARRCFSDAERRRLAELADGDARTEFLRRWSVREAVIKARGGTLAEHLAGVVPSPAEPARLQRLPTGWGDPGAWDIREITGHPAAIGFLAAPGPLTGVRGFRLTLPPGN